MSDVAGASPTLVLEGRPRVLRGDFLARLAEGAVATFTALPFHIDGQCFVAHLFISKTTGNARRPIRPRALIRDWQAAVGINVRFAPKGGHSSAH
jgi:hypothetical protein